MRSSRPYVNVCALAVGQSSLARRRSSAARTSTPAGDVEASSLWRPRVRRAHCRQALGTDGHSQALRCAFTWLRHSSRLRPPWRRLGDVALLRFQTMRRIAGTWLLYARPSTDWSWVSSGSQDRKTSPSKHHGASDRNWLPSKRVGQAMIAGLRSRVRYEQWLSGRSDAVAPAARPRQFDCDRALHRVLLRC